MKRDCERRRGEKGIKKGEKNRTKTISDNGGVRAINGTAETCNRGVDLIGHVPFNVEIVVEFLSLK